MTDEPKSVPESGESGRFVGLLGVLTADLGLKAVALVMALAFWGSVQLSTDVHEQLSLRVIFVAPDGQIVVGDKTFRVQISAVASLAAMEQYRRRRDGELVHIPTDSFGLGPSTIYLNRDLLGLPKSLQVDAIRPSVVRVNVARRITKQVPVKPEITGTPSAGLTVKRWDVIPDQVTIDGPEDAVNSLAAVIAGPISVEKEVRNLVRTARLRTGVLGVQVVDLHEAEVRVEIAAPLLDRRIKDVPVVVKSKLWAPVPTKIELRLKGPLDTLNRLEAADLRAVLSEEFLANARAGVRLKVRIEGLPQGVVRLGPVPQVRLEKKPNSAKPKEKP